MRADELREAAKRRIEAYLAAFAAREAACERQMVAEINGCPQGGEHDLERHPSWLSHYRCRKCWTCFEAAE